MRLQGCHNLSKAVRHSPFLRWAFQPLEAEQAAVSCVRLGAWLSQRKATNYGHEDAIYLASLPGFARLTIAVRLAASTGAPHGRQDWYLILSL